MLQRENFFHIEANQNQIKIEIKSKVSKIESNRFRTRKTGNCNTLIAFYTDFCQLYDLHNFFSESAGKTLHAYK